MATAKKPAKKTTKKTKTIQTKKRLNLKIVAVIVLVAAIGGYFLYTSHAAYPREWNPAGAMSSNGALYYGGGTTHAKGSGVGYWDSNVNSGWAEVHIDHLIANKDHCVDYEVLTPNSWYANWSVNITNSRDLVTDATGKIKSTSTVSGNSRTVCVKTTSTIGSTADNLHIRVTNVTGQTRVWKFYQK